MIRRNLLLKRRSIKITIAEILIPCIFLAQSVLLGGLLQRSEKILPAVPDVQEEPFVYPALREYQGNYPVGYAPESNMTAEIMEQAAVYWSEMNPNSMLYPIPFANEAAVVKRYMELNDPNAAAAGIIFNDENVTSLSYTLRFAPSLMPPTSKPYIRSNVEGCRPSSRNLMNYPETIPRAGICFTNAYASAGFTAIQNVLAAAYAKVFVTVTANHLTRD